MIRLSCQCWKRNQLQSTSQRLTPQKMLPAQGANRRDFHPSRCGFFRKTKLNVSTRSLRSRILYFSLITYFISWFKWPKVDVVILLRTGNSNNAKIPSRYLIYHKAIDWTIWNFQIINARSILRCGRTMWFKKYVFWYRWESVKNLSSIHQGTIKSFLY